MPGMDLPEPKFLYSAYQSLPGQADRLTGYSWVYSTCEVGDHDISFLSNALYNA